MVGLVTVLAVLASIVSPAAAGMLRLPPPVRRAPATIARECPECASTGFMPCGTSEVAYGKRFARTALQGRPARGYLTSFVMSGEEFRRVARQVPYDVLIELLRERFSRARLVILDAPGARVLPPPDSITVEVPPRLHACVHESAKPWGCCVAANCSDECCEKGLGSPTIQLRWNDPKSHETIELFYHHATGFSQLKRRSARGEDVYYCLVDGPAWIEK